MSAPERIFLQWNGDECPPYDSDEWNPHDLDVTWASQRIFEGDVEYAIITPPGTTPSLSSREQRLVEDPTLIAQCPVCNGGVPLYFDEGSKDYVNSCPDCYASLTLKVVVYEGEV